MKFLITFHLILKKFDFRCIQGSYQVEGLSFDLDSIPMVLPAKKGYFLAKYMVKENNENIIIARASGFGEKL